MKTKDKGIGRKPLPRPRIRNRYEYLCEVAEELNEIAKDDGSNCQYVVIQDTNNNWYPYRIVCLRKKEIK